MERDESDFRYLLSDRMLDQTPHPYECTEKSSLNVSASISEIAIISHVTPLRVLGRVQGVEHIDGKVPRRC